MDTIAQRVRRTTGIAGAGARRAASNRIKKQMQRNARNAARRVSAGGQGG